jgi:hypothetical protein
MALQCRDKRQHVALHLTGVRQLLAEVGITHRASRSRLTRAVKMSEQSAGRAKSKPGAALRQTS